MVLLSQLLNNLFVHTLFLEFIFFSITFLVSLYSFKIYKISFKREIKLFAISFLLISLSYLSLIILNTTTIFDVWNLLIVSNNKFIGNNIFSLIISSFFKYSQILLFSSGLLVLTYMTLGIENKKTLFLLFLLVILPLLVRESGISLLYFSSSIMLLFIIVYYINIYRITKQIRMLLILAAFVTLFLGTFNFVFAKSINFYFIAAHILTLVAYTLILISLLHAIPHGKKKKQA